MIFDYCFEHLQETVLRPIQCSVSLEGNLWPATVHAAHAVPSHLSAPAARQGRVEVWPFTAHGSVSGSGTRNVGVGPVSMMQ